MTLEDLAKQLNELAVRMDQRFEAFEHRFDKLEQRFDALEHRFDALEHRFDNLEHTLADRDKINVQHHLETKSAIGHLEERFTRLQEGLAHAAGLA